MKDNEKSSSENPAGIQINISPDTKILYSDSMFVHVGPFGVVLDFAQTIGPTNKQQTIVSRVGMSKEHAKAMINVIKQKLDEGDFSVGRVIAKS